MCAKVCSRREHTAFGRLRCAFVERSPRWLHYAVRDPQRCACTLQPTLPALFSRFISPVHVSTLHSTRLPVAASPHLPQVELALTTILDTIALRDEHEVMNHINAFTRLERANIVEQFYVPRDALHTVSWIHPFKGSVLSVRNALEEGFATVEREALFTAPNITWLRPGGRPEVHEGHM